MEDKPPVSRFSQIFPASCILLGALVTAVVGWISNYQQATISARGACIARIDTQEAVVRDKYNKFLVEVMNFSLSPKLTQSMTESELRDLALPVVTSATEIITYTTPEMALNALSVIKAFSIAIYADDNIEQQNLSIQHIQEAFKGAHTNYYDALNNFAKQRKECN